MANPDKLGKYEIHRELGRGAMGVVYEAYDPMIKRVVALKTIRADALAGEDSEAAIARFRREAQAAGRLSHPNIVSIYDFGEEEGTWYIAMEFVKGRELKDYFQANERFATSDIVRIMTQVLSALDYSHKQGIVHRDIKPANVIILDDGTVKVADFGIAHIETSNMTQLGTTLGTPAYMSPEQIQGLPVDGRSDLFSAGVILYQFLTGERPFVGTSTVTMRKVLEENPLAPSRFNVQVPAAMDNVVQMALAKRPEDRFQNAKAFITALHSAAQVEGGGDAVATPAAVAVAGSTQTPGLDPTVIATAANRTATPVTSPPPITPVPPAPPSYLQAAPAKPSNTAAIAVIAVVVAVALGAGGWFVYNLQSRDTSANASRSSAGQTAQAPSKNDASATAPSPAATQASAARPAAKPAPGTISISAVGLVDPSDPRYVSDPSLSQSDLRADAKRQIVEKAVRLLVESGSVTKNYDLLKDKLLSDSGKFVTTVVQESAPTTGKDGLMSMTTQAVVNVKAVQKSLNEMSREDRIQLIRATGDPKIAVRISVRDAEQPDAPPQASPVAENVVKERIKSFGFRTWSEEGGRSAEAQKGADFDVSGEAKIKKLSMRLQASGLTITKYALTSMTVKAIDRETGEEIYYNTQLPKGLESWPTEEDALKAIGAGVADDFSREFFLQHVNPTGQRVSVRFEALPKAFSPAVLERELLGLPTVISAVQGSGSSFDMLLAGGASPGDEVAQGILKPLNAKLGAQCFNLGAVNGEQVAVTFDKRCDDAAVLGRLETNPPAGLYGAPPSRQKTLIKNPELLRKLLT